VSQPQSYRVLQVFVSSPSDVEKERQIAKEVIHEVGSTCSDALGLAVNCLNWERLAPIMKRPGKTIQSELLEEADRAHVIVLILNKRCGSKEPKQKYTNTEREVRLALAKKTGGKRLVLAYFKKLPRKDDPGPERRAMNAMRTRINKLGVLHKDYSDHNQFRNLLTHGLYERAMRFHASTTKQKHLKSFWRLGIADGDIAPKLSIVYPPVDRAFMHPETPDNIWAHRLAPHVVFENFKAIQKIDKTLRLLGLSDFHSYGTASLPEQLKTHNRVWICLPRNRPAQKYFEKYAAKARFKFTQQEDNEHSRALRWKTKGGRTEIEVLSPLNIYLHEQREHMAGGTLQPRHLQIVARDYAVLARFSDMSDTSVEGIRLKDYFVSGLRGLGTWGAGWFIDRQYRAFEKYQDDPDKVIQMLLEITYVDGIIDSVKDVSEEEASYFERQHDIEFVRREIAKHR